MRYNGYTIDQKENGVIVHPVTDFNPVHIFECGQCFRWRKEADGGYTGIASGRVAKVRYDHAGELFIDHCTVKEFTDFWFDYFDLGRDYAALKAALAKDDIMKRAMEFGYGIRLLRQDIWETLISFIISSNNRIPRIMKIISSLSELYGQRITYRGQSFYSFPTADRLASAGIEQVNACRTGYRCRYIVETSRAIRDGAVDLDRLPRMGTDDARNELLKLCGVGNKVADCTLLYSGTKYDVFPTDVWVKRVMETLYFKREVTLKELQEFVKDYFGGLAGFAQQYLFYYARENRIGVGQ